MEDTQTDRIAGLEAEVSELRADNMRLRQLLDERDAPGELRHRQRNSIAMMRLLVRSSAETDKVLSDYVLHLEDRLDAIARVQTSIDNSGQPDLGGLIAGELLAYTVSEGGQATLTGPRVLLQPQAAQTFALAIHELAVNAIEHGTLGQPAASLDVRWQVAAEGDCQWLTLVWKEAGSNGLAEPDRHGFGTEVLTETLPYELKATTTLAYEPDGLRCTIRIPLPERIGRVVDDAEPD